MASRAEPGRAVSFDGLLRRHRALAGLTQEELAERAELSVRGLRYLEQGLHRPFPDTVARLVDVLGLSDEERRVMLTAARPRDVPFRVGQGPSGGGVPVPPSPLIGREREVAVVAALLRRAEVRVVTLTGPGGVGKTRLAVQVAADLPPVAIGEAVWVPLAPLGDSRLVESAIAQALSVTETGALPVPEALILALRDRPVLLLLDNFEHVAAAADLVSDLVARCASLKVLVTSRAALRLRDEYEFPVPPLPLPALTAPVSVYALAANPAVDLFLRRAQAVRPDFRLTPTNAAPVAEICRRLDGLPLAVELAAPRMRVLSAQAMLLRLEHRLAFLTGGARDLPDRQRTMRDTIDWSYELLDAREQTLLRRLAVFAGGCNLAAVEALGAETGDAPMDLLDGIESLQRNSLLQVEDTAEDEPRLRMLQTVREYALERLAASGEEEQLRQRHAAHYLSFAEEAARGFYSPATALWLDRVEQDHDNLRAVLRWCIQRENAEIGLRVAAALWSFWYVRGYATEGRAQLAALLALPAGPEEVAPRAEALLGAGQLALTQGDYRQAWISLQDSIAMFRKVRDDRGGAGALLAAGFVARVQEDYETARTLLQEGLLLARATGHTFITAACLHHLGMIAADDQNDAAAAGRLLNESLTLYRALTYPRFVAQVTLSMAAVALAQGDLSAARDLLLDSLTGMHDLGEKLGIHGALDTAAHLAAARGQTERAVRLAGAAEQLRTTSGTHSWPVVQRSRAKWLATARNTLGELAYHRAWTQGQATTAEEAIACALEKSPSSTAVGPPPAERSTLHRSVSSGSPARG